MTVSTLQPFDEELTAALLQYRAATNNAFKTPEEDLEVAKRAIKEAVKAHIIEIGMSWNDFDSYKSDSYDDAFEQGHEKLAAKQRSALGLKEKQ